jgi:C4-dicarboxylate transporter DctM subunit
MNLTSPFSLAIVAITALSFLGLPIGHSMIAGSILYLFLAGLDMGTAAEQILNGMYTNYIMLAVPLFILAAELMNIGSMTDRLMVFCNALVGRFRGGLAQVNIVQSIIFAGMSGLGHRRRRRLRQDDAAADDQGRQISAELRRGAHRRHRRHRADHSAIDPDDHLCARLRRLHRLPVPRRRGPRPAARPSPRWASSRATRAARTFPVEEPTPLRELPRITWRSAFRSLMMPVVLLGGIYSAHHHADRGRRGGRRLCAGLSRCALPQRDVWPVLPLGLA